MTSTVDTRSMPADLEAERAILGAVLLAPSSIDEIARIVVSEVFSSDANRIIFETMLVLHRNGSPIELTTLRSELADRDALELAGGAAYISSLIDGLPSAVNVQHYADIIKSKARLRTIANAANAVLSSAMNGVKDLDDRLAQLAVSAWAETEHSAEFERLEEGRYRLTESRFGIEIEADHLRRERGQLYGEVTTKCAIGGGARTTGDGILSSGNVNLSSQQVRDTQGKYLAARARTGTELDWTGLLEEFCHRVLTAERQGDPAVSLRDVQLPSTADEMVVDIDGLAVLLRHPAIIYGDGGVLKSMLVLYILGRLAQRGIRVLFCDWELDAADHRSRLEQLFGDAMPDVAYLRCDRPLVQMVDQVRRTVRDQGMQFVAFDSIGMACDGPPESAETAMRYMQSVRRLGEIGSLHVGHVSKGEDAHRKPFGSVYWHNTARATWNAKLAEGGFDEGRVTIGLYNKKANLGPRQQAVGFEFAFGADGTQVRRVDLAEVDDLAAELPLHQRLRTYLKHGARTRDQISAHFEDVKSSTLRSALHRGTKRGQLVQFPAPDGDKIGLSKEPQS